ncbi:MAG: hypothetical protein AAFQ71_11540 [Planctomycetota bacterium]
MNRQETAFKLGNAIAAFVAVQSIAFTFAVGNSDFVIYVQSHARLGLTHWVIANACYVGAMYWCRRQAIEASDDAKDRRFISNASWAWFAVIPLFSIPNGVIMSSLQALREKQAVVDPELAESQEAIRHLGVASDIDPPRLGS